MKKLRNLSPIFNPSNFKSEMKSKRKNKIIVKSKKIKDTWNDDERNEDGKDGSYFET